MRRVITLIAVAAVGLGGLFAFAQEKAQDKPKAPTQEEMMAAMMKAAALGPEHAVLKSMAGKFNAAVEAYEAPGMPPEKSKGTANNELILGGRYLKDDYSGTIMGNMPFHGMGLFGFDNTKKKYVTLWIDEMSTQMQISEGTADSSGKVITVSGPYDCPMDNTKHTMKQVWTITDDDHHTMEAWDIGPDGKENKMLTIAYTRAKD
jgi:hypothetical protein